MTPRERFVTAVRGETPDLVPVSPLIHCRYANHILAAGDWSAVFEVHRMLGSVHFRGPLGIGHPVDLGSGWESEGRTERGPDGRIMRHHRQRTPRGDLRSAVLSHVIEGDPLTAKTIEYMVKSPRDWPTYRALLEQYRDSPTPPDTSRVVEADRVMKGDGVPSVGMGSVFGRLGGARGMQELLIDLIDEPDLVQSVADVASDYHERLIAAFLDSPSEVLFYDICWATGAGISPAMFERWVLPDISRVAEQVHSRPGKYVGLYTLGRIRRFLPMMVASGVDFVETFEPNEGDITLAEAKRLYGERICLMGNFDCLVLARGSVEEARAEARRCLSEGMDGGGYVLVTGDEVPADARWDNLRAMVDTVNEHGWY